MKQSRFVFLVSALAFSFVASSPRTSFAQTDYAQVEEWYERGQYQEVINAVVPDPNAYNHSIFAAAWSLLKLNRSPEARVQFERLLTVPGGPSWYWMGLAGMRLIDFDYQGARDAASQAALAESFDLPWFMVGYTYLAYANANGNAYNDLTWASQGFAYSINSNPYYTWTYWYGSQANYRIWDVYGETWARDRFYGYLGCFIEQLRDRNPKPGEYWSAVSLLGTQYPGCSLG